ncbi:MAG: hypothetical protein V4760_02600 [Bdellovibrionota bacterium]
MKMLFTILALGFSLNAKAGVVCQSSYLQLNGSSVSLNCFNGSCTGWVNADSVFVNQTCDGRVSYNATGMTNSEYVSGFCSGGFISTWIGGGSINLRGNCTDGKTFDGSVFTNSQYVSGSCTENGYSTLFISGQSARVSGSCN